MISIKLYNFAQPIIALREKYNLTQQQIAEMLCCSIVTISRVENGIQVPSMKIVETALQLLGEDSQEYLPYFLSGEEQRGYLVLKELERLYTQKAFVEMRAIIHKVEQKKPFTTGLFKQNILLCKIVSDEKLSQQERQEKLLAAIQMTKKDFSLDDIASYLLSYIEIRIIGEIAATYHRLDDNEKAVQVMYGLKACIDRTYLDETEKARTYPPLLFNLSVYLGALERNDEMYEICLEAKKCALRNNRMRALPSILATIAHYYYNRKNYSGCKDSLLQAYYTARAMEQYDLSNLIMKVAEDEYKFSIDAVTL